MSTAIRAALCDVYSDQSSNGIDQVGMKAWSGSPTHRLDPMVAGSSAEESVTSSVAPSSSWTATETDTGRALSQQRGAIGIRGALNIRG